MTDNNVLFVDLSNFFNGLLRSGIDEHETLRDYFCDWLDFDLLGMALAGSFSAIWVFHSRGRIGSASKPRIDHEYVPAYIDRINRLEGVTARDVDTPRAEREIIREPCPDCGAELVVEPPGEKGVDASLIVHLFDTMDAWHTAYLLSGDADFAPAVASLRRRGKRVIGAGFPGAAPTLVRECYEYVDVGDVFLQDDFAAYTLFKKGGLVERWFTDEIQPRSGYGPSDRVQIFFQYPPSAMESKPTGGTRAQPRKCAFKFVTSDAFDPSSRDSLATEFKDRFGHRVPVTKSGTVNYSFTLGPWAWVAIQRRFEGLISSIEYLQPTQNPVGEPSFARCWRYNNETAAYDAVPC